VASRKKGLYGLNRSLSEVMFRVYAAQLALATITPKDDLHRNDIDLCNKQLKETLECVQLAQKRVSDTIFDITLKESAGLVTIAVLLLTILYPTIYFLLSFLATIFWYTYEAQRSEKNFKKLAPYLEKDVSRSIVAAQRVISRVFEA